MDFKTYLSEAKEKTAVMAFGRYNPPTAEGHGKVFDKVADVAQRTGGTGHIIASHSENTAKDPLPQSKKIGYIKKMAPKGVTVSGSSREHPSIFHQASKLHDAGHQHLVVVAGSDRVDEYKTSLNKYNGVKGKHGDEGYLYDVQKELFYAPQPYPSWTWDSNFDWQPPTPRPEDGHYS